MRVNNYISSIKPKGLFSPYFSPRLPLRFAGFAARSVSLAENNRLCSLSLRDLSKIAMTGSQKKTASPASVDKYVKYVHKKKKLHVNLGGSLREPPSEAVNVEHEMFRKKKVSLVFLSQGLRSDETSKMRSILKRFGVSLHMVPLRL